MSNYAMLGIALSLSWVTMLILSMIREPGHFDLNLGCWRRCRRPRRTSRSCVAELGIEVSGEGAVAIPEQVIEWEKSGTHVPARVHILVGL